MIELVGDVSVAAELRAVLKRLAALFGTFHLQRHMSILAQGYFESSSNVVLHGAVEELCAQIKPDAVALVDAIAPPDFILNSVLGRSDGLVYQHLEQEFADSMKQRPSWWQLVLEQPARAHL